jgi:hypothetical protein
MNLCCVYLHEHGDIFKLIEVIQDSRAVELL